MYWIFWKVQNETKDHQMSIQEDHITKNGVLWKNI